MYIYHYQTLFVGFCLKLEQNTLYQQALILHILFMDYFKIPYKLMAQTYSQTEIYFYLTLLQKGAPTFNLMSMHIILTTYQTSKFQLSKMMQVWRPWDLGLKYRYRIRLMIFVIVRTSRSRGRAIISYTNKRTIYNIAVAGRSPHYCLSV